LRLMTLVWGMGLTAETLLRCWLAWHWPVERCLAVLPLISYSIYVGLMLWTTWFRGRLREREGARDGPTGQRPDGTPLRGG
jgi:hypothetical protein